MRRRCSDVQLSAVASDTTAQNAARVEAGSRWLLSTPAKGSDGMTDELITRLAAANPVPHDGPLHVARPARLRPSWRIVLSVIVAMAALAGTGIAIADGLGVFSGISSVQHPQTTGDLIDPATEAYIERKGCTQPNGHPCAPMIDGLPVGRRPPPQPAARRSERLRDPEEPATTPPTSTSAGIVGPPDTKTECNSTVSQSHPPPRSSSTSRSTTTIPPPLGGSPSGSPSTVPHRFLSI